MKDNQQKDIVKDTLKSLDSMGRNSTLYPSFNTSEAISPIIERGQLPCTKSPQMLITFTLKRSERIKQKERILLLIITPK